jgi:hypothetical protein
MRKLIFSLCTFTAERERSKRKDADDEDIAAKISSDNGMLIVLERKRKRSRACSDVAIISSLCANFIKMEMLISSSKSLRDINDDGSN